MRRIHVSENTTLPAHQATRKRFEAFVPKLFSKRALLTVSFRWRLLIDRFSGHQNQDRFRFNPVSSEPLELSEQRLILSLKGTPFLQVQQQAPRLCQAGFGAKLNEDDSQLSSCHSVPFNISNILLLIRRL